MTSEGTPPEVEITEEPRSAEDFIRRGWSRHVHGDFPNSEADFRKAISLDSTSIEGFYGLGLSLKIQRREKDAVPAFEQALKNIAQHPGTEDTARRSMLKHLAESHINMIRSGLSEEPAP